MARKKKKKSSVNINAIDKYLMQKKYTRDSQENKTTPAKPKLLNVVLQRVNIDEKSVNRKILSRKCREKSDEPATKKTHIEKTRNRQKVADTSVMQYKTKGTKKSVGLVKKRSQKYEKISVKKLNKSPKTLKRKSILERKKRGAEKLELINKKSGERIKLKAKPVKKRSEKVTITDISVKTVRKSREKTDKFSDIVMGSEKSEESDELIKKGSVSDGMKLPLKLVEKTTEFDIESRKVKLAEEQAPESSQLVISKVVESCFFEANDSTKEIVEERNPLTKKYQPYMERIKLLTSESIKKYIFDNQQYYVDLKNKVESNIKNFEKKSKKRKEEFKETFKCNPFSSAQQITMFNTLREIFNIPQTQFKECRNFFTVLIPEISCQLFAETFHIKVSFAPRLIKKLYPNPVCPV